MGDDIYGWVEVSPPQRNSWYGVVQIDSLVARCPPAQAELFGNRGDKSKAHFPPVESPDVGDYSQEVSENLSKRDIRRLSQVYCDELFNVLPEIRSKYSDYHTWDSWEMLFDLIVTLAGFYEKENVRLVVWFS